jgi:hypothetical protein
MGLGLRMNPSEEEEDEHKDGEDSDNQAQNHPPSRPQYNRLLINNALTLNYKCYSVLAACRIVLSNLHLGFLPQLPPNCILIRLH